MFNIGGWELLVILVLALVVLGPDKLPQAAREFGRVSGQLREMARGFQREFDAVRTDLTEAEARARGAAAVAADPGPRGNLDTFVPADVPADDVASDAPAGDAPADDVASDAPAAADGADEASTGEESATSSEDRPLPMADPFAGLARPSFDASATPSRNIKPVSAVVGDVAAEKPEPVAAEPAPTGAAAEAATADRVDDN